VKTIFDRKTGQLLGAHMVGAEVTELIQGYVVASRHSWIALPEGPGGDHAWITRP
jgi:pyruvate/2-oxoglutarate dehydrogenase complex dihydrolipoamide dehydrogenase (E3) component